MWSTVRWNWPHVVLNLVANLDVSRIRYLPSASRTSVLHPVVPNVMRFWLSRKVFVHNFGQNSWASWAILFLAPSCMIVSFRTSSLSGTRMQANIRLGLLHSLSYNRVLHATELGSLIWRSGASTLPSISRMLEPLQGFPGCSGIICGPLFCLSLSVSALVLVCFPFGPAPGGFACSPRSCAGPLEGWVSKVDSRIGRS